MMQNVFRLAIFTILALAAASSTAADLPVISIIVTSSSEGFTGEMRASIQSILTARVAESGLYTVTGSAEREAAIGELEFSLSELSDSKKQLELGKLLSADLVLTATLGEAADRKVVQITLVDVATGTIAGSALDQYQNIGTLFESIGALADQALGIVRERTDEGLHFVSVRNASELLRAIASNTVITLESGTYDLSNRGDIRHDALAWQNNYDGFYPVIQSVANLTLKANGRVTVVIEPAYGWILEFKTSHKITLEGIAFVHKKPGYCLGGVLRFETCDGVDIRRCTLDGSGTYGIEANGSRRIAMYDSTISHCTYGIMELIGSSDLLFSDCRFMENREFTLIELAGTANVSFLRCSIVNNQGSAFAGSDALCRNINFTGCRFSGNRFTTFLDGDTGITMEAIQD